MKQLCEFFRNTRQLWFRIHMGCCLIVLLGATACRFQSANEKQASDASDSTQTVQAESDSKSPEQQYLNAKKRYTENPNDSDALIWYGRRTAYLGNYEDAIQIFTTGIERHSQDARMYRHRGHRYISTRQYDKAILDFEQAATLTQGQPDEVEPDGLPNNRNLPLSTLQGNIWYHLGLAYYLKNDMDNALRAFSNRTVTEKYDDNVVSGGHWLYMILSRMGKTQEADAAISKVTKDMDIIENSSYHTMCLFYKGLLQESELQDGDPKSSSANVLSYGLGNWYLYKKQDTVQAKKYYRQLLDNGNTFSFAYIAAEADWERIFQNR